MRFRRLALVLALVPALPATAAAAAAPVPATAEGCDPNYWPCIPPPPPDLDCADVGQFVWVIGPSDPHRLDGNRNGVGCEDWPVGPAGPPDGSGRPPTTTPPPPSTPTTPPPPPPVPACTSARTTAPPAPPPAPAGAYTALAPVRVADTRATGALAAGESRTFAMNAAGVPADASIIAMNVTAVDPTATGYLTVYPGGASVPQASNLNVVAGTTIANLVLARVSNGQVTVYNSAGCTHVLIDVVGYARANTGNGFVALSPSRAKDTRTGAGGVLGAMNGGDTHTLQVAGTAGVPVGADAVAVNVTVVDPTAMGFVTVAPSGGTRPEASTVNFAAGTTIANLALAKLDASGRLDLYLSAGTAHVLVDVFGYYAPSGATYIPVAPVRLHDVRGAQAFAAGEQRDVQITGQVVPANATAVALNVTAVDPTATGYVTIHPAGDGAPGSSNLNVAAGRTIAGLTIVKLGAGGRISVFNSAGRSGIVLDLAGYFTPVASGALPALTVSNAVAPTAYSRAAFGEDWIDADGDCHNTRAEVLMTETSAPVMFNPNGCTVATGRWTDPWSGFTSTLASDFEIDHHVPLANAWRSGAWAWTDAQRRAFAQDLADVDQLNATHSPVNQAKSDLTPDQWRPPLSSSWCRYATSWATIKANWNLTVTSAELVALQQMTATC